MVISSMASSISGIIYSDLALHYFHSLLAHF
uniref:Uncharacterized protein n=1 Tax=Arundo donax TaxID=35708 RepID=A0A0A9CK26_ARUDO